MNPINQSIMALCALATALVYPTPVQAGQTAELSMMPLFELNPTDPADKDMQSRRFDTEERTVVVNGSLSVLQDMGYSITGGNRQLGLVTAKRKAEVPPPGLEHALAEAALVTTTIILSLLTGQDMVTDLPEQVEQTIYISLLVSGEAESQIQVRLSIDRDMRYDNGRVIPDHTELTLIYQEFFEKLSRSVFLEAHQL
jgi:hypothetical protein